MPIEEILELKKKIAFLELALANLCEEKKATKYKNYLEEMQRTLLIELKNVKERLDSEIIRRNIVEDKLAKTNQTLSNTLETMSDGIEAVNKDWVITYVNKIMLEALEENNLNKGHVIGSDFREIHSSEPKELKEACVKVMNDRQPMTVELYSLIIAQWVKVTIYRTNDGINLLYRKIDRPNIIEKLLKEEYPDIHKLFKGFPHLVCILKEDRRIIFENDSFEKKFGSGVGRCCFETIAGSADPCEDCMLSKEFVNMKEGWTEWVVKNCIYKVYSQPFTSSEGSRLILKVLIDVTDKRQEDVEMARFDRLNMMGEMAAGMAHEVRNPMTTVRGFLQLLQSKDETADYHEFYQLMIAELDRANAILTDFLSLAQKKSQGFERVNITEIVSMLIPLLTADALNQDKKINYELESVPDIQGNADQLRQLVLNLARNGLEAMEAGGFVTLRTYACRKNIIFQVCDQGEGVATEILEKLGTPFLTTKEGGTGLGIAVCQKIALRHNAAINFDSGPKGTMVTVRFAR